MKQEVQKLWKDIAAAQDLKFKESNKFLLRHQLNWVLNRKEEFTRIQGLM